MATVSFTVPGLPQPQGSKVFRGLSKQGKPILTESAGYALQAWRTAVMDTARRAMNGQQPFRGAVCLEAVFRIPRPANHYGTGRNAKKLRPSVPVYCITQRRDWDKLSRGLCDALKNAGVYADDGQIVEAWIEKVYTAGAPETRVSVKELT